MLMMGKMTRRALAAGGKPSTWLPPGGLVEHIVKKQTTEQTNKTHTYIFTLSSR